MGTMGRWEPDAEGRLQEAAMALFRERGYAEVTVAEIAERAGLTKRTFFNHFADKREVLFAGSKIFEATVLDHLAEVDGDVDAVNAAVVALTRTALPLAGYGELGKARQDIIASSPELRERDLIKMTSLAAAIAEALRKRGVPERTATFAAQSAVAVFTTAFADWVTNSGTDLETLMRQALADLREAIA